jgi:hypothetical protein
VFDEKAVEGIDAVMHDHDGAWTSPAGDSHAQASAAAERAARERRIMMMKEQQASEQRERQRMAALKEERHAAPQRDRADETASPLPVPTMKGIAATAVVLQPPPPPPTTSPASDSFTNNNAETAPIVRVAADAPSSAAHPHTQRSARLPPSAPSSGMGHAVVDVSTHGRHAKRHNAHLQQHHHHLSHGSLGAALHQHPTTTAGGGVHASASKRAPLPMHLPPDDG